VCDTYTRTGVVISSRVLSSCSRLSNKIILSFIICLFPCSVTVHRIRGGQLSRSDGTSRIRQKPNGQTQKGM